MSINSNSSVPPNPSYLLGIEREKCNINTLKVHAFLEGSPEKSKQILQLYQSLERDVFLSSSFKQYDETRLEEREQVAKKIARLSSYIEIEDQETFWKRLSLVTVYDPSLGIRVSVNLGLFFNCVKGNGTDSQYDYWSKKREGGNIKQIYGCFAMTELGHGSNVAGCETTAIFDPENDSFIINTPHIGATKWWIGGAAHSATHSVVYARLIVKNKDYGVKCFIVPLRDCNHDILPGISIGDIGAKMGREGVDNGWIQYSKVSIPRYFMLQKWCKVSATGEVVLPPLEQVSYISLLGGRVAMATDSYRICARFITIATRYGICRVQFRSQGNNDETQLLDYPLHQKRLLPYLSLTYAMALGTNKLEQQHKRVLSDLEIALENNDQSLINKALIDTKSLFIASSSLKSTLTWLASECIDECRQACGGHGYSAYSGFGKSFSDWSVQQTWEGDNNVLAMSVGKTIVTNVYKVLEKNAIIADMQFLEKAKEYSSNEDLVLQKNDLNDPISILTALEVLIIRLATESIEVWKTNGYDWNTIAYQRVVLSKLICHQYLLSAFINEIAIVNDASLLDTLSQLLQLYSLCNVLENFSKEFLTYNIYSSNAKVYVSHTILPSLLLKVRKSAVALTDSFQQSDNMLNSAIGKYNGDIYSNYFSIVKEKNPPFFTKAPYSEKLESILNRSSLIERERYEKSPEVAKLLSK